MNLAEILAQGVPPPSFTMIQEELHPGERKQSVTDRQTDRQTDMECL